MSIQERIDLVGNVSAQARAWTRDINKLAAATKALNRAQSGGTGGGAAVTNARAARAPRSGGRSQGPKTYGPGRQEAGASAVQRHREETRAAKQSAAAQARAARQQSAAEAKASRQRAAAETKAAKDRARAEKQAAAAQAKGQKTRGKTAGRPANDNAQGGGKRARALPREEVGGIGGTINSAIGNFAADAMAAATAAIAGLMKSLASTFLAAQMFKEQSLAGLEILQKSGTEAKKTWDESFKIARDTGSTQQETMTAIQSMMSSGFKKNDAVEMYKLMTAMSVVNPAANLEGIARAIGQIKNTGRLQGDELMQLADAGVNVDEVYNQLGKRLKKSRAEIMKMQEAGEIKSDDAIAAIKEAMKTGVGGDPEAVLKKRANSMTAILSRLQAAPFTFFSGIEANPALADKMKASLTGLVDLLDPSTAKGAKMAAAFSKLIDLIAGPGADAFAKLAEKAPAALEGIMKLATAVAPLMSVLGFFIDQAIMVGEGLSAIGDAISYVAEQAQALAGFDVFASVPEMIAAAVAAIQSLMAMDWTSVGMQAMSGLASGILGGMSSVISAAIAVASAAINAANSALAIHSPSREFAAMGKQIPAGLAKGTLDNMGVVEKASEKMAGTSQTATQKALPFVGSAMRDMGMGGGGATQNYLGGMRINAPIQMMNANATPMDVQSHIKRMIDQGVQGFMNTAAEAA